MKKKQIPDTSKEAYQSLDPSKLRETYKSILYALSQLGEATTEECAAFLKIDHERLWKRYSELANMGLIYRPGNKRLLRSGRNGFTWRLTKNAIPATTAAEKALRGPAVVDYSRKLIIKNTDSSTQIDLL
jgi:hypothetical protein